MSTMTKVSFITAVLAAVVSAEKYKIGVFTDIHLQPNYVPNRSPDQYCEVVTEEGKQDVELDTNAYFGRMGCDVPYKMVDVAMQKMAADHPDIRFLLAPGDLIGHDIPIDLKDDEGITDKESDQRYAQLMETHRKVASMFEDHFADIPVLPAFGNNDTKYHYQPAYGNIRPMFNYLMYKNWFEGHDANKKLDNLMDIKETMHEGGWYRANLVPDKLTLLVFNSLHLNAKQEKGTRNEFWITRELEWLEEQLSNANPTEKFLLEMHIYETADWWYAAFPNWKEDNHQTKFLALMKKYHDKILFEVTGHDHMAGLRVHQLDDSDEYYLNKVIFPGLTASSNTNPGFGTFEYDSET